MIPIGAYHLPRSYQNWEYSKGIVLTRGSFKLAGKGELRSEVQIILQRDIAFLPPGKIIEKWQLSDHQSEKP
jgi:hypothetical protein